MWVWGLAIAVVCAEVGNGRKAFVGGNWKANGTVKSAAETVTTVINRIQVDPQSIDVVVAPAFPHLSLVASLLHPTVQLAAQTCSSVSPGPFTGEVTVEMLTDLAVTWVILGHSERRVMYGETDVMVAEKMYKAQRFGLKVVLCIGESLQEKQANQTISVLTSQLEAVKDSVADWRAVVIAYEPIWAIGSGKTATASDVEVSPSATTSAAACQRSQRAMCE